MPSRANRPPGVRKCGSCRKPFTVKIGTIFEASHIPMNVWLQAIFLVASSKKGISSNQLHRSLGITLKSAWFMSHRIRESPGGHPNSPTCGHPKFPHPEQMKRRPNPGV